MNMMGWSTVSGQEKGRGGAHVGWGSEPELGGGNIHGGAG
jgi:hypothetical protein